ncbi:hypothetical protein [Actinophytocola sp. KF-1]
MEGSPRKHAMYYRCPARTLAPGSPALATHPAAVYLREDTIREAVNGWFAELFHRDHIDRTVAALVASQDGAGQKVSGRRRLNVGSPRPRQRSGGSMRRSLRASIRPRSWRRSTPLKRSGQRHRQRSTTHLRRT